MSRAVLTHWKLCQVRPPKHTHTHTQKESRNAGWDLWPGVGPGEVNVGAPRQGVPFRLTHTHTHTHTHRRCIPVPMPSF